MVAIVPDQRLHSGVFLHLHNPLLCVQVRTGGHQQYAALLWLHAHCCVFVLLVNRLVEVFSLENFIIKLRQSQPI